ncbi:MAG: hypothetical protein ACOZB3_02215 [Calditrichota bacterium]
MKYCVVVTPIVWLVLILTSVNNVFGQCIDCVAVFDNTCACESCYFDELQCSYREFTAACSGNYTLAAEIQCSDPDDCANCVACVWLYAVDKTPILLRNVHTTCQANQSWYEDTSCCPLGEGSKYRIYVSLQHCEDSEDCSEDCSNCSAKGWVFYPGDDFEAACQ